MHEMLLVEGSQHMKSLTISGGYTEAQVYLQCESAQTIPREAQ